MSEGELDVATISEHDAQSLMGERQAKRVRSARGADDCTGDRGRPCRVCGGQQQEVVATWIRHLEISSRPAQ